MAYVCKNATLVTVTRNVLMSSLTVNCGLVSVHVWQEQMQMTEVMHKLRQQKGRTAGDDRGLQTTEGVTTAWTEGSVSSQSIRGM